MIKSKLSPYFRKEMTVKDFQEMVVNHIDLLRMPVTNTNHQCSRECHAMERNHTLETLKHFITNVSVDN